MGIEIRSEQVSKQDIEGEPKLTHLTFCIQCDGALSMGTVSGIQIQSL